MGLINTLQTAANKFYKYTAGLPSLEDLIGSVSKSANSSMDFKDMSSHLSTYLTVAEGRLTCIVNGLMFLLDGLLDSQQGAIVYTSEDEEYNDVVYSFTELYSFFAIANEIGCLNDADGHIIKLKAVETDTHYGVQCFNGSEWANFIRYDKDADGFVHLLGFNLKDINNVQLDPSSLLNSLVTSSELDGILQQVTSLLASGASVSDIIVSLSSYTNSYKADVKLLVNDLITNMTAQGELGAITYIKSAYSSLVTTELNSDGQFEFVDNDSIAPFNFNAGFLAFGDFTAQVLLTGLKYIGQAILTMIGLPFQAIYSGFSAIVDSVNNLTYAKMQENANFPAFPYSASKSMIDSSTISYLNPDQFASMVWASENPMVFRVGHKIAFSWKTDAGVNTQFFIDCIQRVKTCYTYFNSVANLNVVQDPYTPGWFSVTWSLGIPNDIDWNTVLEGDNEVNELQYNADGTLTAESDALVRLSYYCNVLLEVMRLNDNQNHDFVLNGAGRLIDTIVPPVQSYSSTEFLNINDFDSFNYPDIARFIADIVPLVLIGVYRVHNGLTLTDAFGDGILSWEYLKHLEEVFTHNLADAATGTTHYVTLFQGASTVNRDTTFRDLHYTSGNCIFYVALPKLSSVGLWRTVIAIATGAVIVSAVIIGSTFAIKRGLNRWAARRTAKIEQLWSTYTESGKKEDLNAYIKAVRRNNIAASIFGGTKYDKYNYWGQAGENSVMGSTVVNVTGIDSVRTLITGE